MNHLFNAYVRCGGLSKLVVFCLSFASQLKRQLDAITPTCRQGWRRHAFCQLANYGIQNAQLQATYGELPSKLGWRSRKTRLLDSPTGSSPCALKSPLP
jgi:hypothetical protein